ncbi:MAG: GNAT family N-acetyltransferase [Defluviitaleaceae bacterium]|nr:GNAT family N-acetyltransferase [Defluviitaleaceae bacterium]MCL2273525.1 GNAT family N-acetyltransferase [Defluviitaleaceae bacterium]
MTVLNERILYDRFYELHRQNLCIFENEYGQAVYSAGAPLWVKLNTAVNARSFFYTFLREKLALVFDEFVIAPEVARECAEVYKELRGGVCTLREMLALYLPNDVPLPIEVVLPDVFSQGVQAGMLTTANDMADYTFLYKGLRAFGEEVFGSAPAGSGVSAGVAGSAVSVQEVQEEIPPLFVYKPAPNFPPVAMGSLTHGAEFRRLNLIYTPKENRRRGYGNAVVSALCALVRSEGKIPVLYVYEDNAAAVKLYQGLGFAEAGQVTEVRVGN